MRLSLWACALLVGVACTGCARWNWRGTGYNDGTAHWADKLRPATGGQPAGLDARAVDIERNLGVR